MSAHAAFDPTPLPLPGALLINAQRQIDQRGSFVKTFHADALAECGLRFELREEFYSVSTRNVLRGMHFQTPPADHTKLVTCMFGRVLDVLLDLRRGSPTFGQSCSVELTAERPALLWIPAGIAHGFLSLSAESCMLYRTDCEYDAQYDAGVRSDSFGFTWPIIHSDILISDRDKNHPALADFDSPFTYKRTARGVPCGSS